MAHRILKELYTNPSKPSSFSSVKTLWLAARQKLPLISKREVREFLSTQPAYTLYRNAVRKFPRLQTQASGLHTDWQVDLLDFKSTPRQNGGHKYLLVIIDVLSRFVFVEPVKSKGNKHMIDAFEAIFKRAPTLPWRMYGDSGLEISSLTMKRYLKSKTIEKIDAQTNPRVHAGLVERVNRTIRERLRRYFFENKTKRWVDVIQKIVLAINTSIHSTTKMRPIDVNPKNALQLCEKLYSKNPPKRRAFFKEGDYVRIECKGLLFKKHDPNFSTSIFIIDKVLQDRDPVVYKLKELNNTPITGYFYGPELIKTAFNIEKRVQKVLRSRLKNGEKESLVKWMGLDDSHNEWVLHKKFSLNLFQV